MNEDLDRYNDDGGGSMDSERFESIFRLHPPNENRPWIPSKEELEPMIYDWEVEKDFPIPFTPLQHGLLFAVFERKGFDAWIDSYAALSQGLPVDYYWRPERKLRIFGTKLSETLGAFRKDL